VPGPSPHYRPSSPDESLTEARRLVAARTAASHLRQRARMVLLLHEHPPTSNAEAWDVQRGRVMGRCEAKTGIEPFGRLVERVMQGPEYRRPGGRGGARGRVFWVADNGSSHRGEASVKRSSGARGNAIPVHTPARASWLNQVGIYFPMLRREALTPNDSADLRELESRIRLYEGLTNQQPRPFDRKFTKYDLFDLLQRLARRQAAACQPGAACGP
jgi:hypothetical protein